jgi:hypothetical protein
MSHISPKGQRISYLGNTGMLKLEDTSSMRVINLRLTEELPLIPHGNHVISRHEKPKSCKPTNLMLV